MKNSIYKFFILLAAAGFIFFSACNEKIKETSMPLYELKTNTAIPKFDADNAYQQIKKQKDFGPRNPGSTGHKEALVYLQNELGKYADQIKLQSFTYPGYDGEKLELTNIIGKFNPDAKKRIMLCAHWDTRPRAEKAVDPSKRNLPIIGANDGGSGVGVLLEIARLLKNQKVDYGIDIIFLDGEDYGKENDLNNFCLGSKYYSAILANADFPVFSVLLDLVGDKEANFKMEGNSIRYAPEVVKMIWGIAAKINATMFSSVEGPGIYDDHIPLNQAGLKTVDIIDAELVGADSPVKRRNYWHSHKDLMDNIGKNALQQVGDVMTNLIYSLKFNS